MGMFLALVALAIAISGTLAFVLFWALVVIHLRDRHPALKQSFGAAVFTSPRALGWLLIGRYRNLGDRSLNGLAHPARIALICTLLALLASGLLWLVYH